ncbi:TetR/AcrR family transcriptional regulator [Cystobacter fuscus]|uniref:TetR/AcrR family transcriptional regulator n=1 Tax=Cystobacter fuscus TaxID=43 RepID=UPI0037BF309B
MARELTTTNAIAERAGVNIASLYLYQYFPNKAAIVAELRRRHLEQLRGCHEEGPPPRTLHEALWASVEPLIRQRKPNGETMAEPNSPARRDHAEGAQPGGVQGQGEPAVDHRPRHAPLQLSRARRMLRRIVTLSKRPLTSACLPSPIVAG